ncbi:ras GEF [Epithele typhae]|uniref:ras GEF n=1 Tax=Epithele typhae TaxID=378194 RepID=UPI002008AD55|nr:ras GEF [Epithele typhae]KAH9920201.1 ras GEF [Epithele typhae]
MAVQVLHHNKRRAGLRPRLWIDPNPSTADSSSLSTPASPFPRTPELFYVLCLYDYDAEDSDQLSFRRNDILDVVKKEDTGWWAAIHLDDDRVGWIPSAFVEPISDTLADKLRSRDTNVQIYQAENDDAFHGSPDSQLTDPFIVTPEDGNKDYEWMPVVSGDKLAEDSSLPSGVGTTFSPLVPPPEGIEAAFLELEEMLASPTELITSRMKRRSRPKPLDSPALDEGEQVITLPPAPSEEMPITPRTPGSAGGRRRSLSLPTGDAPPSDHQRSRSESAKPPTRRHLRRRPLLIDDQSSLNRLTTLFEAHNIEELDHLIASPVVAESFDAFTRTNKTARDKVLQITGDNDAQAFHDAQIVQGTWYLRPHYGEEEIMLQPNGSVTAGTLRALVERLTFEFPKPIQGVRYRQAFLMTHKSFSAAEEVLDLLIMQFNIEPPSGLSPHEMDQWTERRQRPNRRRVLTVLQSWTDDFGLLQDDHHLAPRIVNFVSSVDGPPQLKKAAQDVLKSLERFISVIPATPHSAANGKHKKNKAPKAELLKMDPQQLAEHLCMLEQRLYSKIRPQECMDWVRAPRGPRVKNLAAFSAFQEKLGPWVKMSILNFEPLGKRAEMIDFWVKVAEKCKALNNYASLHAVVAALSSPVIARLHFTWAHVKRRAQLEQLAKYHDPAGNLSSYRLWQRSADGPCIPHIAMHLTDMQAVQDQLPDDVRVSAAVSPLGTTSSLIHFAKREKWWEALDAIHRHQARPYALAEDAVLAALIDTNLLAFGDVEQNVFWTKSQEIQQAEMLHADIRKGLELAGF